jgi:L-ascorbate metabolism protein UlaG (beta-lactamase superfamily)
LRSQGTAAQSPGSLLQQIREHRSGVAVWWVGHNGWLIKSGDVLIATDLVLEDRELMSKAPISPEELAGELDVSFVTHGHGDHFHRATSKSLLQRSKCMFVVPASCTRIAKEMGIPNERIRVAIPRQAFELKGVQVQALRAIHGNSKFAVYYDANLEDCGYLFTIGGKTILQPGDSVLLEDHLFLKHVNVLFFSPTEHNTHIDRSVILINELEPDYILPQHRDTYRVTAENRFWTNAYEAEVKTMLPGALQAKYHILDPGQKLLIQ